MVENNEDAPDQDPHDWLGSLNVRVLKCGPGRADKPVTGEPVAMLTLTWKGKERPPLMIPLTDARKLLVDLVYVLKHFGDSLAQQLVMLHFPEPSWPMIHAASPALTKPSRTPPVRVRPSIHPDSPPGPIRPTDVWQLIQMVQHAKNHDDFLRLIGAPTLKKQGSGAAKSPRKRRRKGR